MSNYKILQEKVVDMLQEKDTIFSANIQYTLGLRKLILDPDLSLHLLSSKLSIDPVIVTEITKLAESFHGKTYSLSQAMTILGIDRLNFILFSVLQKQLIHVVPVQARFLIESLWKYGIELACSSAAIASTQSTRKIANEVMAYGIISPLALMFVIYAASSINLFPELDENFDVKAEYVSTIRRVTQSEKIIILKNYGIEDSDINLLNLALTQFRRSSIVEPYTALECLALGISGTNVPKILESFAPIKERIILSPEQLTYKRNILQNL